MRVIHVYVHRSPLSFATLVERYRPFSSDLDSISCVDPSKGSGRNKGHQDAVDLVRD